MKRHHRMDGCLYFMHVRSFPLIICLWCYQHSSWKLSYPHHFTSQTMPPTSPSSFKSRQSNHCMMSLTFLKINQNMFLIDLGSNTNLEWLGICTYAIMIDELTPIICLCFGLLKLSSRHPHSS